jgi:peptidoglycan/LPS O-acetylase OafA/YrhL
MIRYRELDSLRGLAALTVFWGHLAGVYDLSRGTFFSMMTDGTAAVDLFFVLSGFVLTIQISESYFNYKQYAVKRFFRLYPLYLFVILVAIFLSYMDGESLSGRDIMNNLIMVTWNGFDVDQLGLPIWTIIIEMKISLLFPVVVACLFRFNRMSWDVAVVAFCFGLGFVGSRFSQLEWLRFLPLFAMGAVAARRRDFFHNWIKTLNVGIFWLMTSLSLALYWIRVWVPGSGTGWKHFVAGFGACLIIVLFLSCPQRVSRLNSKPLLFIGLISYSVYLVHALVIRVTADYFQHRIGYELSYVAITLLVMLSAYATFRMIENPGIRIGKRLSGKLG